MYLRTLGGLGLDGCAMRRPKPLLLLAYLCLEGPKSRRFLSDLFFADSADPSDALSTTLRRLRKVEAVESLTGSVLARVSCDAVDLLKRLDEGAYERGLAAYSGRFLDGLDLSLGPELEEWIYSTRERLGRRVRYALLHRAEAAQTAGDAQGAAQDAESAFTLAGAPDPEPEDLLRMLRLTRDSRSSAADGIREQARQADISLAPSAAERAGPGTPRAGPAPLPTALTNLIGRDEELVEIARLLNRHDCRLLTLHGAAGVGKSRLALQAASDLLLTGAFEDGIVFVPVEALASADQLCRAVAERTGVALSGEPDEVRELVDGIGARRMLVVLDSFEHLTGAAPQLRALLRGCPGLKLLVSSRQRLNMASEWLMPIAGLRVPSEGLEYEDALLSDAVQLFVRRAQAANVQFRLEAHDLPLVRRICTAVDGFPLGIELAAVWTRTLPLDQLARNLESNLRELGTKQLDGGGRHPDLWAALEHSWTLLTPREQQAFARCSVFKGGFSQDAFAAVAQGSIDTLMSLVDKSLVRRSDRRFELHALLKQFAREKLEESGEEAEETAERHADYFCDLLNRAVAGAAGTDLHEAFALIGGEQANFLAGFAWAAAKPKANVLVSLAEPLLWYFPMSGGFMEGDTLFASAIQQLPIHEPGLYEARAALLLSRAWLNRYAGSMRPARELGTEGERLARAAGSRPQLLRAIDLRGQVLTYGGQFAEARELLLEGVAVAREHGEPLILIRVLTTLALSEALGGLNAEAEGHLQEAIEPIRQGQVPVGIDTVAILLARGVSAWCRFDHAAAVMVLREGVRLARELDYLGPLPLMSGLLASALLSTADGCTEPAEHVAEAESLIGAGMAMVEHSREGMAASLLHGAASALHRRRGDLRRSHEEAKRAYTVARDSGNELIMLWSLPELVRTLRAMGDGLGALHLSRSLQAAPASPSWLRQTASDLEADLLTEFGERPTEAEAALDDLVGVW